MIMTSIPDTENVLIFDFGSQYAQLIARRVREQNVFCQLVRANTTPDRIRELKPKGIILSGGPASVYENGAPHCDPKIFDFGVPVLGICYGMQLAAHLLGGKVVPEHHREFGRAHVRVKDSTGLFKSVPSDLTVWMSHGDQVQILPSPSGRGVGGEGDFVPLASTETCPVAAMRHSTRPIYGLQFHPEVSHTQDGSKILHNFLYDICGCTGEWKLKSFIEQTVAEIRQRVGKHRVICGLSGGVDSSRSGGAIDRASSSTIFAKR